MKTQTWLTIFRPHYVWFLMRNKLHCIDFDCIFILNCRILGRDCNTELFQHHYFSGSHDDMVVSQSKDAIIYVTVSIQSKTQGKGIESWCLFNVFLDWILKMRGLHDAGKKIVKRKKSTRCDFTIFFIYFFIRYQRYILVKQIVRNDLFC